MRGARLLLAPASKGATWWRSAFRLRREHRYHTDCISEARTSGLRLPGELRHPLEPIAHRAAPGRALTASALRMTASSW